MNAGEKSLTPGDAVYKIGGDYRFDGFVVAIFQKKSGEVRMVVEDDRGVLFICRPEQYGKRDE